MWYLIAPIETAAHNDPVQPFKPVAAMLCTMRRRH
jgi:hypothetical protein